MEENLNELASEFFQKFSRMEYALKAAGFHHGDGNAKANWTAFANSIPGSFDGHSSEALTAALQYIREHPPKKQVVREGVLEWRDVTPESESDADLILLYIRRVRNNLFHGGKFNGRWFEPQRSRELLQHCLVVLDAYRDASEEINSAYKG